MPGPRIEPELQELHDELGSKAYLKLYAHIYTKTLNSGNKRYSGKRYCNTKEKLEAIKMKYANGVPAGEIEKMVRGEK
jgi:hypothetical protein